MSKYMVHGSYTLEGIRGLQKEGGTSRRKAAEAAIKAVGGNLESFYFAFGGTDVIGIADVPDNVSAAALALTFAATGTIRTTTTVLITPEEMDQASKKAIPFRGAGQ